MAQLFAGANQTGVNIVEVTGASQRYEKTRASELISNGLWRQISSTSVFVPPAGATSLICFGFPFAPGLLPDFTGQFVQFTNLAGSPVLNRNLSSSAFDNQTESALLVKQARAFEVRLSFRALFLTQWRTVIDAQLSGTQASRDGDPILTWEMFPAAISGLDPLLKYLKITQGLDIAIDGWWDYKASLTYWLLLSLDSGGTLQGFVARQSFWVESGIKHNGIVAALAPQVSAGAGVLNIQLASALSAATAGFTFTDLYYMPGNQTGAPATGVITGFTTQDVTIVLQL
ncbi:MAG TPA: hypothetical protein VJ276_19515 [Thermoanaerobaculia bacterium]|nr:hypothetical protein [Thermoanaerobaculia bacterium]